LVPEKIPKTGFSASSSATMLLTRGTSAAIECSAPHYY
jgi:hypothetical protein